MRLGIGTPRILVSRSASSLLRSKFSVVPSLDVLRSAADVYFSNCQNQPYCYFHEESFRHRLEEGMLPSYLLLTFMATAARYSFDQFFEGRKFEAMEIYARAAWRDILKLAFSSDLEMDLYTVAATNMLAVVDFTGPYPTQSNPESASSCADDASSWETSPRLG